MSRRSKAREVAVQMLYQIDLNPEADLPAIRNMMVEELLPDDPEGGTARGDKSELRAFAWRLFVGVRENRAMLDSKIEGVAANWSLKRMAPTDRNVLRLGLYELMNTETPHRVVLDEAIELARVFGSSQSAQFVNGILDKLVPDNKRSQTGRSGG